MRIWLCPKRRPGWVVAHQVDVEVGPGLAPCLAAQAVRRLDSRVDASVVEVDTPSAAAVEQRDEEAGRIGVVGDPAAQREVKGLPGRGDLGRERIGEPAALALPAGRARPDATSKPSPTVSIASGIVSRRVIYFLQIAARSSR